MLRPNAIGLSLALRFSNFRPIGLSDVTRSTYCCATRELFAWFFSSFDANDVIKQLADRLRNADVFRLLLRIDSTFDVDGACLDLGEVWPFSACAFKALTFTLDDTRVGGLGGLV